MSAARELVIVGAGPGGMAAAATAARQGLDTLLLDEQAGPGGQIYRDVEAPGLTDPAVLGPDYLRGRDLAAALRGSSVDYAPQTSVWQLGRDLELGLLREGRASFLRARRVILATGAVERPMPIPGWTLPGVMTAGAGQLLLKSAGLVPDSPTVLAGSGPLLLLLAWQYLRAGVRVEALLDTTPRRNYLAAAPLLPAALGAPGYLGKGLKMLAALRAARLPMIGGVEALRALGETRLEGVAYRRAGREQRLSCALLLLHQGVLPHTHLAVAAGCEQRWDDQALCWRPALDRWGNSSVAGIAVAGDGGGIVGALGAEHAGHLAALDAARALGRIQTAQRDRLAAPHFRALARHQRVRPFLDRLYRPAEAYRVPADETLVCRCEEISAGEIRRAVDLGCTGPNQTKSYTRCGMGPCQGRVCGTLVSEIIAAHRRLPPQQVGYYRIRPPLKPITLEQLAAAGD